MDAGDLDGSATDLQEVSGRRKRGRRGTTETTIPPGLRTLSRRKRAVTPTLERSPRVFADRTRIIKMIDSVPFITRRLDSPSLFFRRPSQKAAKLAPDDQSKPIRFALKSLRIKQKEAQAARRRVWGGVFRRRGDTAPAPGRRQVEEAAARARGEGLVDPRRGGGSGDGDKPGGMDDKWLYLSIAVGVVAFALAGFAAAKFTQSGPPTA